MDYTNNLHLPQWEKSDRIMMDDFNDAFSKLDTAVKANSTAIASKADTSALAQKADSASVTALDTRVGALEQTVGNFGLHLLKNISLDAACESYELNLSDINWSAWRVIHMEIIPQVTSLGSVTVYVNSTGSGNSLLSITGNTLNDNGANSVYLQGYPMFNGAHPGIFLAFAGSNSKFLWSGSLKFNAWRTLILKGANGIELTAGTTLKVWGET